MIDLTCPLCNSDNNVQISHDYEGWTIRCEAAECGGLAVAYADRKKVLTFWRQLWAVLNTSRSTKGGK